MYQCPWCGVLGSNLPDLPQFPKYTKTGITQPSDGLYRRVKLHLIWSMEFNTFRGYFRLKLSPTSGCCPQWLIFFKNLFYQKNCKEAMNIGGGQIRVPFLTLLQWKSALFCIFQTLPSVSKITSDFGWLSVYLCPYYGVFVPNFPNLPQFHKYTRTSTNWPSDGF